MITLYEKDAAIAIKLEELAPRAQFRPEFLLRKASAVNIAQRISLMLAKIRATIS